MKSQAENAQHRTPNIESKQKAEAKSVIQGKWLIWKRESEGDSQLPAGRCNLLGKGSSRQDREVIRRARRRLNRARTSND